VNTPVRHSGMACILKGSHSFTCTPRVHPLTEWTIPAFAFPAEAGTYLLTPEGWEAELALASATAEIACVGSHYPIKVIQGHWCWYQSKDYMQLPISEWY